MRKRRHHFFHLWRDQRGNDVAQAAAIAFVAVIVITALKTAAAPLGPGMNHAIACTVAAISGTGNGACGNGDPFDASGDANGGQSPANGANNDGGAGGSGTGQSSDAKPLDPPGPPPFKVERVNQCEATVFFSQYEDSTSIPPEVLDKYLTNPQLMDHQKKLIQDLVDHVQKGGAPLTPGELYQMALKRTQDPGTALLVSHNVLKALARGRSPIPWEKVSSNPLVYKLDGQEIQFDDTIHPDAVATKADGARTVFYQMFSPQALGTDDTGDWYHYFLEATANYYATTGRVDTQDNGKANTLYGGTVCGSLSNVADQMKDPNAPESDAYKGYRWANALSFLEGGYYGGDNGATPEQKQAETSRESRLHQQGALLGLLAAGQTPGADWTWYIPTQGSIGLGGAIGGVNVPGSTHETLDPTGKPIAVPAPGNGNNGGGSR